jgi:hypothetical protein
MFCPICKSEAGARSNRCPQCGANLLAYIPANEAAAGRVLTDSEGRELLWSGLSLKIHAAICRGLADAGIEYKASEKSFGLMPATVQTASFIWVSRADRPRAISVMNNLPANSKPDKPPDEATRDAAILIPWGLNRTILGRALEGEAPFDAEYSLFDSGSNDSPTPDDLVQDFKADEATCEVWVGEDARMAQYFDDCLRGVGIGCVVRQDGTSVRVLVLPAAEKRAREVIREIVEASPPQ